jgi:tetratricopeptide (TPR) repeat protein
MAAQTDSGDFLTLVLPYLKDCQAAELAQAVLERWTVGQVVSLVEHQSIDVRRVAAVVLGLIGDVDCVPNLTSALHDSDSQVNRMAEHSLWSIWFKASKVEAIRPFNRGVNLLNDEDYEQAIIEFERSIQFDPDFAEAYNQTAIAHFFLGQWPLAIEACENAIGLIPVHFGAIACLGHCQMQVGALDEALECYRQALSINPCMPGIGMAITQIQEQLRRDKAASGTFLSLDVVI